MKAKDKIIVFIKLVRKYGKKLSTLSNLLPLNNDKNNIFNEIYNTINQFCQMIFNPKLNENTFEMSEILITEDSIKNNLVNDNIYTLNINNKKDNNINFNYDLNGNYHNLIKKYEDKFKVLISENDSLRKMIKSKKKEKGKYGKYIIELNEKLQNEKNINEDLMNKLNSINNLNEELENKNHNLQNENIIMRKKYNELSENLNNNDLIRNKNEMLLNDLNYKNSVIKYLENLLRRTNLNPKLFTENTYKEEYIKSLNNNDNEFNINENLIDNNDSISNFNNIKLYNNKKNDNNNINLKENIQINNILKKNKNISNRNRNRLYENEEVFIRPTQIKREIECLDDEILNLQNQIKKMLNK